MRTRRIVPSVGLPVLLVAPAGLLLGLVLLLPIVIAAAASLFRIDLLDPEARRFAGFDNYARLFESGAFWTSLRVTLVYSLGTVAGAYALGLLSALLLRRRFRGRGVVRTLVILPWAVPQVVAVMIWSWIFDANYGVLNYVLRLAHLTSGNLTWLETPALALVSTVVVTVWCIFPVATVMLLAGLAAIPAELYEAASVDGAGPVRQFSRITWPALGPVNLFLILMLFLLAFTRVITIIYVMTGGGPSNATNTLPVLTYLEAFKFSELGYGSATGTVVLVMALLASFLWLKAMGRGSEGLK